MTSQPSPPSQPDTGYLTAEDVTSTTWPPGQLFQPAAEEPLSTAPGPGATLAGALAAADTAPEHTEDEYDALCALAGAARDHLATTPAVTSRDTGGADPTQSYVLECTHTVI